MPRIVLVTGPGGAGRSTVAAATAVAATASAADGDGGDGSLAVLLLSEEPPARLASLLCSDPVPAPVPASASASGSEAGGPGEPWAVPGVPGLWAGGAGAGERFRRAAAALQERAGPGLAFLGAEPLDEDELALPPGGDDCALLHALHAACATSRWHTVVVDLPDTRRALTALALPGHLRRLLRRLAPPERQAARALRPMLAQLAGVPAPTGRLYETLRQWDAELAAVQRLMASPAVAVRLVAEPASQAAEELRAARAGLALHGLRPADVVANRVLPTGSSDGWLAGASGRQQSVLKQWREEYGGSGLPLHEAPHLGREPRGAGDLADLAAALPVVAAGADAGGAADAGADAGVVEDRLADEGLLVWRLPLPAAVKGELGLLRRGDELLLSVGPHRRARTLPSALRRCRVAGAALEAGELRVRFAPDPALWPTGPEARRRD